MRFPKKTQIFVPVVKKFLLTNGELRENRAFAAAISHLYESELPLKRYTKADRELIFRQAVSIARQQLGATSAPGGVPRVFRDNEKAVQTAREIDMFVIGQENKEFLKKVRKRRGKKTVEARKLNK